MSHRRSRWHILLDPMRKRTPIVTLKGTVSCDESRDLERNRSDCEDVRQETNRQTRISPAVSHPFHQSDGAEDTSEDIDRQEITILGFGREAHHEKVDEEKNAERPPHQRLLLARTPAPDRPIAKPNQERNRERCANLAEMLEADGFRTFFRALADLLEFLSKAGLNSIRLQ